MSMSTRTSRWGRVLMLVAAGLLALVAWLVVLLGATLPQRSGRVAAPGAQREVEVLRDAQGVPHIHAQSERDAYFGLGYVHAQDRAFQIELQLRTASGTLAELIGEDGLASDRLFRTLGLREVARASLAGLDRDTRAAVEAYAAGYNAALQAGANAPELIALRRAPAQLDATACLVALKLVAWQLSSNMLRELENYRLSQRFSFEQMAQLAPAVPGDSERAWPSGGSALAARGLDEAARLLLGTTPSPAEEGTGSNAWAVSGERSVSGKPLLANDPHLGLSAPAVWYLAHLQAPGLNVIGATLPGMPGVWLGRNDHVAWGITNTGSDTQDLYLERVDAEDPARVHAPGGPRAMSERIEEIRVRGAKSQHLVVHATRHGPVISDADPEVKQRLAGHLLALAWTGLSRDDRSAQFAIHAAKARDASQLLAAAAQLHAPQQNLIYADDAGAVGFQAIGRLPLRAAENSVLGRLPVPGWDATYDWQGEVPFAELPAHGAGRSGRVLNANDKITPPAYGHFITSEWELPHRAERIAQLLDARPRHSVEDFARMQLDVHNRVARQLLPELLARLDGAGADAGGTAAQLIARLRAWDGSMGRDRIEPLVFQTWLEALGERLYPEAYWAIRPAADPRVLLAMVRGEGGVANFCGAARDCAHHVRESFRQTQAMLAERYGDDLKGWRWGSHNVAWFSHALFGSLPWVGRLVDLKLAREGSAETVNLSGLAYDSQAGGYVTAIGPTFRAIYDLAQPANSMFIVTPGQSGNPLSPRYRDLAARWERGQYLPMITDRAALRRAAHDRLVLSPAAAQQGEER
jgi:penicillin G amidase